MYKQILDLTFSSVFEKHVALIKALAVYLLFLTIIDYVNINNTVVVNGKEKIDNHSLLFITSIISYIIYVMVAVSTHRILILGENSIPKWGLFKYTERERAFFIKGLLLGLSVFAVLILVVLLGSLFGKAAVVVSAIIIGIILSIIIPRLSLVFPAISIDKELTFKDSWNYTKHYKFFVFVSLIVFPVLFSMVFGLVYGIVIKFLSSVTHFNLFFLFSILNIVITVFTISALSATYKLITADHLEPNNINTTKRQSMNNNYIIRTMTRKEFDMAVEWAAQEGWNPGLHDADSYFQADPNGFFIGLLDDEPIATISAVKYDESFGFLGFYIVKPEYRAKGYGIQIWDTAMKYLDGLNIALDGVVAQQENYKKSGFKLAYRNIRYEGIGGGEAPENPNIVELKTLPFETIDTYDQPFFPANRSGFTNSWINQPDSYAFGMMRNGNLSGYGVIRKCQNGYKIGPLFADDAKTAEDLFLALKSKTDASSPIFLDVPEVNQAAIALAEKYNMQLSFETARMYTKDFPDLPLECIYGVTSFEIG